jgi:biopolymer transport protein ExbB
MLDWMAKGGLIMYPLLVCSVVGLAVVIDRGLALRIERVLHPKLVSAIQWSGPELNLKQIGELARQFRTPFAEIVLTALNNSRAPKTENIEAVQAIARQETNKLEKRLVVLELIVGVAPLLGLFGTVLGMVHIFSDVSQFGLGEPTMLARGIAEALITTVTGLAIAIPALIAHTYFTRKVENFVLEMERLCNELITKLY